MKSQHLKTAIGADRYDINDFWSICPYTQEQLSSDSRFKEIKDWRHVAMCWYFFSGMTAKQAGLNFNRHHSTVLHACKYLFNRLACKDDEDMDKILRELILLSGNTADNIQDKPILSAFLLESSLFGFRPYIYDESKFYCSMHAISNKMGDGQKRCSQQCGGCK